MRDLAGETRATIVTLQETKLAVVDKDVVAQTLGDRFTDNFVALPADGTRGGIILAADDSFKIVSVELGVHSVTAQITNALDAEPWFITAVYEPQEDIEKLHGRVALDETGCLGQMVNYW